MTVIPPADPRERDRFKHALCYGSYVDSQFAKAARECGIDLAEVRAQGGSPLFALYLSRMETFS